MSASVCVCVCVCVCVWLCVCMYACVSIHEGVLYGTLSPCYSENHAIHKIYIIINK